MEDWVGRVIISRSVSILSFSCFSEYVLPERLLWQKLLFLFCFVFITFVRFRGSFSLSTYLILINFGPHDHSCTNSILFLTPYTMCLQSFKTRIFIFYMIRCTIWLPSIERLLVCIKWKNLVVQSIHILLIPTKFNK